MQSFFHIFFFAYFLAGVGIRTDGLPVIVWPADNTWLVLSLGGLMVFCAYSALCFSAFPELAGVPTNHGYHSSAATRIHRLLGSAMPGSPVDPQSGGSQFRSPRGEESALEFGYCLLL